MDAEQQALVAAADPSNTDADTEAVLGTLEAAAADDAAAAAAGADGGAAAATRQKGAKDDAERWHRTRGHPLYPQLLSTLAENSLEGLPPAIAALRQPRVMESPLSPKSAVRHAPRTFPPHSSVGFRCVCSHLLGLWAGRRRYHRLRGRLREGRDARNRGEH